MPVTMSGQREESATVARDLDDNHRKFLHQRKRFQEAKPRVCSSASTISHTLPNTKVNDKLLNCKTSTFHATIAVLTRSFVALEAIVNPSRNSPEARVGMVTSEDVIAGGGGSPIPGLDREHFEGGGAAVAYGVVDRVRTHRHQGLCAKGAVVAFWTPLAHRLVRIA